MQGHVFFAGYLRLTTLIHIKNVWLMSGSSQNYGESWNQPLPGIIGIAFSKAPLGWLSEPTSNDSLPLDGEECRGSEFLDFKSQVCWLISQCFTCLADGFPGFSHGSRSYKSNGSTGSTGSPQKGLILSRSVQQWYLSRGGSGGFPCCKKKNPMTTGWAPQL